MNQFYGYQPNYFGQKQEVVRVNGKSGADMYPLPPSSSALLLDETQPVVWLVQTDGAGYKVSTPYTVTPMEQKERNAMADFEQRLSRLEERLNESNTAKTSRKQPAVTAE